MNNLFHSEHPESPEKLEGEIIACRKCVRLVAWREKVASVRKRAYQGWEYWGKPIPGFGDPQARILAVGLAPGAHGSNRTGRMFTGDSAGDFLYAALYRAGFASQPASVSREDGQQLNDLFISSVCRCAPPENKPTPQEITTCLPYLVREMSNLDHIQGMVALGRIAFDYLLAIFKDHIPPRNQFEFAHGAFYELPNGLPWLLASYHPSRQNTQTGRLTPAMFDTVWAKARNMLKD